MRPLVLALAIGILAAGSVRAGSIDVDFNPNVEFEKYRTWGGFPTATRDTTASWPT